MREDLKTWLDQATPSYAAGLRLLAQTGYDPTSLTWGLLQRGADAFTTPKLRQCIATALTNLRPTDIIDAPGTVLTTAVLAPVAVEPIAVTDGATVALLNERTEAKARLRAILDEDHRAEERRVLALRVKAITDALDRHYHPEAFVTAPKPGPKLTLINVRTYVSRYRKRLREQPGNADYTRLLAYYATLLTEMTNRAA